MCFFLPADTFPIYSHKKTNILLKKIKTRKEEQQNGNVEKRIQYKYWLKMRMKQKENSVLATKNDGKHSIILSMKLNLFKEKVKYSED